MDGMDSGIEATEQFSECGLKCAGGIRRIR